MTKAKKIISIITTFFILIYYLLGVFINNNSYAVLGIRTRENSTEKLTNEEYPGFAVLIEELKTAHPNWTFTILYTGIDWNEVIYNETTAYHGRSLTQKNYPEWRCVECENAHEPGWYCASQEAVAYYMDARNWLNEDYIFAFEGLTNDANIQNIEGVKEILKGTFMDVDSITYIDTNGTEQIINKSYAQIIMEVAEESGVSAYHLASRLRQEQGSGDSGLISGTFKYTNPDTNEVEDYTGYYNYFNISASGSTTAKIIRNGLKYASSNSRSYKWTTPELAIKGGAEFLANDYIGKCQDNIYLQKYCVDTQSSYSLYSHQYMQNISAPYTEGNTVRNAYEEINAVDYQFNFIIPVYENMPETASSKPANDVTIVTENVQTTASYLKIRTGPSTNYSEIASIPRDTIVIRIETANKPSADQKYWDKIVYNTGNEIIIGYSAREYLNKVDDVVTVNELDVTNTSVNLRNGPGTTNTTVIKTLSANTNVTIIDKISYEINGHVWYRVKLDDGLQGYLASTYLKSYVPPEPEIVTNYKIDGDCIIVSASTKLSEISGATTSSTTWGTGATITLNEKQYILVMLGDVSGDGEIKSKDYMMIKNYIMGTLNISDAEKKAADVSKDGEIKSKDYMMIKNHIMGTSTIKL